MIHAYDAVSHILTLSARFVVATFGVLGHALATRGYSGRQSYALSFYRVESVPHTLYWALMVVVVLLTGLRCRRRRSRGLVPYCILNPPTSRNGRLWMMMAPCGVCTPIPFSAALGTGLERPCTFFWVG